MTERGTVEQLRDIRYARDFAALQALCNVAADEIEGLKLTYETSYRLGSQWRQRAETAEAEVGRAQDAKRRALAIADERSSENVALRAENERLKTALTDLPTKPLEDTSIGKDREIARLVAALRSALCPGGGYTGQPADEHPTVDACLKAGQCGCDLGAAVEQEARDADS